MLSRVRFPRSVARSRRWILNSPYVRAEPENEIDAVAIASGISRVPILQLLAGRAP